LATVTWIYRSTMNRHPFEPGHSGLSCQFSVVPDQRCGRPKDHARHV
jgi:hypothetical protein